MGFKESLDEDLSIFFDNEEFASMHSIDNINMTAIIDEDKLEEYKELQRVDSDGLYLAKMVVNIKKKDLGYRPAIESSMKIDNSKYFVLAVTESEGIYQILLGANKS